MCNRVVQKGRIVKPGEKITVLMKGPGAYFELPFEATFAGPAKRESRGYWKSREGAEDVIVPNVERFGEKNKATEEQGWEDVPPGSALEGLLLPQPPGKDYRLLKIVTQPATPDQIGKLGNDRAPIIMPPVFPEWAKAMRTFQPHKPPAVLVAAYNTGEEPGYRAFAREELDICLQFLELAYGVIPKGNLRTLMDSYPVMRVIREQHIVLWNPEKYLFFGLLHQLEPIHQDQSLDRTKKTLKMRAVINALLALPDGQHCLDLAGFAPNYEA